MVKTGSPLEVLSLENFPMDIFWNFLMFFDSFNWTKTFELLSFIFESFRTGPPFVPAFWPVAGKREFRFDFWENSRIMQIIISKMIPQTVTKHDINPSRQKCFFLMKQCLKFYW